MHEQNQGPGVRVGLQVEETKAGDMKLSAMLHGTTVGPGEMLAFA